MRNVALDVSWHRLILDESHELKEPSTEKCRLATKLCAPLRWALSGTPFPSSLSNIQGQIVALQLTPYDDCSVFRSRLLPDPAIHGGNRRWAIANSPFNFRLSSDSDEDDDAARGECEQPLLKFLSSCAIRHTKVGVELALPPCRVSERLITPKVAEKRAYKELLTSIIERVEEVRRGGALGVRQAELMGLLLKLRLACDHLSLAHGAKERMREAAAEARTVAGQAGVTEVSHLELLEEVGGNGGNRRKREAARTLLEPYSADNGQIPECTICLEDMLTPTLTMACELPHAFCLQCILGTMRHYNGDRKGHCPLCRTQLRQCDLRRVLVSTGVEEGGAAPAAADAPPVDNSDPLSSSKLDGLISALRESMDMHPKSVVFTQFGAMQDLTIRRLQRENIRFASISGRSTQSQRKKALRSFTSDASVVVCVLTMKSASVGLTLTCASRLIFLEPGLSLAAEEQAIGRVHRFGQQRPVEVIKLALEGTVEQKILRMQCGKAPGHTLGGAATLAQQAYVTNDENESPQIWVQQRAAAASRQAQEKMGTEQILMLLADSPPVD